MMRIGIVADVDERKMLIRVSFPNAKENMSEWLPVLRPYFRIREIAGGSAETGPDHTHEVVLWLPKMGDQVLVLYEDLFNGRGFVLGGVSAWQQ